jgi:glyoxylase-like metal-dependent hydrolase (beta-lactamase superfamily II)
MRIERVLAPNPGLYTGAGTNTWLLESGGELVVIDPGPEISVHADAIVERVGERLVAAVLVTHTHPDHAPLANPLARHFGVAALGHAPGPRFIPDRLLADGATVALPGAEIEVVHTPGHSDDHLCFRVGKVLFTGDHIMGGSSVMVEKMAPYLASLERLRGLDLDELYPGHGEIIERPGEVIDWYLAHRRQREEEIVAAIRAGATTIGEVVETVYREVDPSLHPLAAVSVRAHLDKLAAEGIVAARAGRLLVEPEERR